HERDAGRYRECLVRLRVRRRGVVARLFRREFWVLSWLCLLLGWWEGEGVCACRGFFDRVRCAIGVNEDGVAYLLNDGAPAGGLGGPTRDAVNQRCGDVVGFDGVVGEDPERVLGVGLAGGL